MFRLFYSAFDALAILCVFLSPIAVVHWLLRSFASKEVMGWISPLNALFDPLNNMLFNVLDPLIPALTFGAFQHMPSLHWAGKDVPVTQGILSFLFTLMYFVFSTLAVLVRSLESFLQQTGDNIRYQTQLQQKKSQAQNEIVQKAKNSHIHVLLLYPFYEHRQGAELFGTYQNHRGKMLHALTEEVLIEFSSPADALKYCIEASRSLMAYYITLRPMDPQPPFRMVLHSIDNLSETTGSMEHCRRLSSYCADNKIILSHPTKILLDYHKLHEQYRYFGLGLYEINGKTEDIYILETATKRI